MSNEQIPFYGSDITFNNKLIIDGITNSGLTKTYIYKLKSDLEYDSIYTTPFTYDSLCPHPIVSDTIPLDDCQTVIVGIDDPVKNSEKTKLHIYPNPAKSQVTVELPQYLVRKNEGSGITATTTYYQWDKTRLDVLNISGRLTFSLDIPKQQTSVQINTSAWSAGMYYVRLVFMNEEVVGEKFVVKPR